MGCNPHLSGWVWRGGDDRIRATCCLISSLLFSSYIFYISDIDDIIAQKCMHSELKGVLLMNFS